MKDSHFINSDENGNNYKIINQNSKLVPVKLLKPQEWGPFKKVGHLTNEGIHFVHSIISNLPPMTWEQYLRE